jgi:RNA polymerase sigma factor (sigma-70 family)
MDGDEFLRRMGQGGAEREKVCRESYKWMEGVCRSACRKYRIYDEQAEDITHDVILSVFMKWDTYSGGASLGSWIFQIARNRIFDELRKTKAHPHESLPEGLDGVRLPEEDVLTGGMEQQICVAQVIAALENEPKAKAGSVRMIELLTYIVEGDPSTKELAAFLNTTEGAAKQRRSYLFKRLKELFKELCGDECGQLIIRGDTV